MRKRSWLRPPRALRATRAGWCFIAIIFGVGFAALNTGNNLLYLVLALMLAFLVLSGLLSETSLRGLRIERMLPRELFAQSPNRVVLRVYNDQRKNVCFAITIEDRLEGPAGPDAAGRIFMLRIGPRSGENRSYLFTPERRGDIRFEGFRVSTRFPFGLFVKSRELDLPESALVYPRVERLSPELRSTSARADVQEEETSSRSNDGDEIAGLREFEPGDSLTRVHWRSSARAGRLLVGEREGSASREFEVFLQIPSSLAPSRVEERVASAASEVVSHLETGSRVGLRAREVCFPPATGFAHRSQLLSFLARVEAEVFVEPESEHAPAGRSR